jgi:hypothetical protein
MIPHEQQLDMLERMATEVIPDAAAVISASSRDAKEHSA